MAIKSKDLVKVIRENKMLKLELHKMQKLSFNSDSNPWKVVKPKRFLKPIMERRSVELDSPISKNFRSDPKPRIKMIESINNDIKRRKSILSAPTSAESSPQNQGILRKTIDHTPICRADCDVHEARNDNSKGPIISFNNNKPIVATVIHEVKSSAPKAPSKIIRTNINSKCKFPKLPNLYEFSPPRIRAARLKKLKLINLSLKVKLRRNQKKIDYNPFLIQRH